ncbi:MAG: hypothetical protein EOM26_09605, partial [Alphaproteobacteria bacterium]|nr:hypothetical protein [Alphaproteobacteria bacterium]
MSLLYTGVNLSGLEFGNGDRVWVDYAVPGREEYDYWSQNVGANVVRLPFTWERLQPTAGGDFDQEYLSYLKDSVGYAKANGMTIILDMHNYARYDGQVTDAAKLSDAWKKLGAEFGGDDSVWFNLMNEPYDIAATKWANITQQVVNDLRAEGIDNKLLLSGTAWSGAHSWVSSGNASAYEGFRDPMNNFAFDVHQYLDGDSSGTSGNTVAGSGSERLVKITEWAESNGFKLFLGEAGVADDSRSIKENGDMLNYMESHGETWIGFSLWGAGPWWGDYYFEINPQGSEHDPAVQALMKHIQNSSAPEVRSEPVPESQPDPVSAPVQTSDVGNSDSGVLFKGVNLAGLEFGKGGTHGKDYICPGKGEYEYWAQDVGSNVVRLPFTWERLQPSAYGELDGEYLGYLKNSVAWAKANGMTIALDMHNYARYDGQITDAGKLSDVWKKLGDV